MAQSEKETEAIIRGNEAYKNKQYDNAIDAYKKALEIAPKSPIANYNLAIALYRDKKWDQAENYFEAAIANTNDKKMEADAWYNKGVSLTMQKKLLESIEAYKNSLRINPADTLARENLQRALNELKKQQQQDQKKNQEKKQQNKLTKQQVQQLLQALQEQEKMLQRKMNKTKVPSPGQPDKDW